MTRIALLAMATLVLVAGAGSWLWFGRSAPERPASREAVSAAQAVPGDAAGGENDGKGDGKGREPTLYCEFTDFADRTPLVGFYFLIESAKSPPAYKLILQREKDGTQTDSGGQDAPRPEWRFDGAESPAVLHSPDDAITINFYDYDPEKRGITWFEAGLRSIAYKNLGGRCRRSAT